MHDVYYVRACVQALRACVTLCPEQAVVAAGKTLTLPAFRCQQHNMRQQRAGYTKLGNREEDGEETLGPDVESGLGQVDFNVRVKIPGEKKFPFNCLLRDPD